MQKLLRPKRAVLSVALLRSLPLRNGRLCVRPLGGLLLWIHVNAVPERLAIAQGSGEWDAKLLTNVMRDREEAIPAAEASLVRR
jgi:hypothetical protein